MLYVVFHFLQGFIYCLSVVYHMKETGWVKVSSTDVAELHYQYEDVDKPPLPVGADISRKYHEAMHHLMSQSIIIYLFLNACIDNWRCGIFSLFHKTTCGKQHNTTYYAVF